MNRLFVKTLLGLTTTFILGFATTVLASEVCSVHIEAGDSLRFNRSEIVVPDTCRYFTVTLEHTGALPKSATGHNWVLTTSQHLEGVARQAYQAGAHNNWLAPNDTRIIAHTPVIGRGELAEVILSVKNLDPDIDYRFLCTVGGHSPRMRGTLRVVSSQAPKDSKAQNSTPVMHAPLTLPKNSGADPNLR